MILNLAPLDKGAILWYNMLLLYNGQRCLLVGKLQLKSGGQNDGRIEWE